jgi:MFS family permease
LHNRPAYILPLIVFAQFAGTSLWFAGNAILGDLVAEGNHLSIGWITSMVQFGFISGTLLFAIFSVADRFSPSKVFLASSFLAAIANIMVIPFAGSEIAVAGCRFVTGFFLAGIYPVGMKIASDWFHNSLGHALGFLLAALVLGTGFPHLLKAGYFDLEWKTILICISCLAVIGGLIIAFVVKDGPHSGARKKGRIEPGFLAMFREKTFRKVAFGYFGHMWELYAFWAFIPTILLLYGLSPDLVPLWSFIIIAVGAIGCIVGGYASLRIGNARVAFMALLISGVCCLGSGLFFRLDESIFLLLMMTWGLAVITDSPQFSTMVAKTAPPQLKGTALSIVTSIGFAITIGSISLLETIIRNGLLPAEWCYLVLLPGPVSGLIAMRKLR